LPQQQRMWVASTLWIKRERNTSRLRLIRFKMLPLSKSRLLNTGSAHTYLCLRYLYSPPMDQEGLRPEDSTPVPPGA
jgi:hypothetical protein